MANGVSEKHGEVSRDLWQEMFPETDVEDVPITHITNGVHAPTWIAPVFQNLFEKYIGKDWNEVLKNANVIGRKRSIKFPIQKFGKRINY